jgi:predicted DsbA family dithiol-disulfide isomerase
MSRPVVEFFSDLHCPHAYLTRYRLRQIEEAWREDVRFRSRCLSIELDVEAPTPKHILAEETPMLALLEEDLPYEPWPEGRTSAWPVTFLPAFEAVKAAGALDPEAAWDLDWRIREAFFGEHRCVSLRHVLADLAEDVGLDQGAFLEAFDAGHLEAVVAETEEGWYEEEFTHSPTIRLPDGSSHTNPGDHWTDFDPDQGWRVTEFDPGLDDARRRLEELVERAAGA